MPVNRVDRTIPDDEPPATSADPFPAGESWSTVSIRSGTDRGNDVAVPLARSTAPLPAAVLWDLDGTLVDTEPYWIAEQYALVAEYGGSWSDEHAHALVGNDLIVAARYLQIHGNVPLEPEQIVEHLLTGVIARIRVHIPWRPGARELLTELNAHAVPCALVTMSYQSLAQAIIENLPSGAFSTVVAGDDVTHGKPHPEPYLMAAARLGIPPARCVAIEDSLIGVTSAQAAGVPVLAVENLVPIPPAPGRTVINALTDWSAADLASLVVA